MDATSRAPELLKLLQSCCKVALRGLGRIANGIGELVLTALVFACYQNGNGCAL